MKRSVLLSLWVIILAFCALVGSADAREKQPNIIVILADDMGLGDVKTYGGDRCKIDTPHMDRLAEKGMTFTDAHSSSSVCTPTRYSVLTGRYNFRVRKSGVLNGYAPALITPGRETVASMLKRHGYATATVGKWHLGMGLPTTDGKEPSSTVDKKAKTVVSNFDWKGKITNGPCDVGFDYFYGTTASLDMPPYVWVDTGRITAMPNREEGVTKKEDPYGWYRKGPIGSDFHIDAVLPHLFDKAISYVQERAPAAKSGKPFFLYLAYNAPHFPVQPPEEWLEKVE